MIQHEPSSAARTESLLPLVMPVGWSRTVYPIPAFINLNGLTVLFSAGLEEDGKEWLHVSMSRPDRLPSWKDVRDVKVLFVGAERVAYQVLPPERDWYSLHPYTLHLWAPVDGQARLPDFRRARGGVL